MLKRNGIGVGIDHFPYRKKPCLYVQEGNVDMKVASFNSEETAEWFKQRMGRFFSGLLEIDAEYPELAYPTWLEWLIEQGIYVGTFIKDKPRLGDLDVDLRITDKVYQPIPADIAEKLGVEPKEGT